MKRLLILIAVAALAAVSFGQGRGMMMMRGGGSGLQLATRDDVAKELGLTADQKSKLQDASDKMREERRSMFQQMRGNGDDNGQPDRAAMDKMRQQMQDEETKTLAGILSADQMKRLQELRLQREGIMAVTEPDIQTSLGLSDDQKKQISDLQQKQMDAMREIFQKVQNQEIDREDARPLMEKNMKIMQDELAKILTKDQTDKLEAMKGKPFTFDPNDDPQGPGGGN